MDISRRYPIVQVSLVTHRIAHFFTANTFLSKKFQAKLEKVKVSFVIFGTKNNSSFVFMTRYRSLEVLKPWKKRFVYVFWWSIFSICQCSRASIKLNFSWTFDWQRKRNFLRTYEKPSWKCHDFKRMWEIFTVFFLFPTTRWRHTNILIRWLSIFYGRRAVFTSSKWHWNFQIRFITLLWTFNNTKQKLKARNVNHQLIANWIRQYFTAWIGECWNVIAFLFRWRSLKREPRLMMNLKLT